MKKETWGSHLGVILAVSGSAVGLGNFLKFPGLVASYGGAAFMIAYVFSFFIIAMPLSIVEWTLGRQGGALGYNSSVGILYALTKKKIFKYIGILGVLLTAIIFCYYIYIEAWCLGYAVNFLFGNLEMDCLDSSAGFFAEFVGIAKNGGSFEFGFTKLMPYFLIVFFINFYIIYRGVSKGIEFFCKYAMPVLFLMGIILAIRILTLPPVDATKPEQTVEQGLGFMWNPEKITLEEFDNGNWIEKERLVGDIAIAKGESVAKEKPAEYRVVKMGLLEQLLQAKLWMAATGQVFFSLTVGFGAIMTYTSYMRKKDDVVMSSVAAASTNEFCEICIGGLITVPAAVAFFGVAGAMGAGLSLFDLGFKVLPVFFNSLPFGSFFGFLFFGLLFIGAVTSSISMLQPSLSFLEESVDLKRKTSVSLLLVILLPISFYVAYHSEGLKALDTMDFWAGTVFVYIFAIVLSLVASTIIGAKKTIHLANENSLMQVPMTLFPILKYFTPTFLIIMFVSWLSTDVFTGKNSYINDIFGENKNMTAITSFSIICVVAMIYAAIIFFSKNYNIDKDGRRRK